MSATYIDPRGKVFAHLDRIAGWRGGQHPAPVTVEVDLSNRCVLGCQDCHFAHTHVRGPWATKPRTLPMAFEGTGDLIDAGKLLANLALMKDAGVQGVVWSGGGEPTTHPEWVDVVALTRGLGLRQGMYTCGGLVSEGDARDTARSFDWVVVSLDACDRETYAREKGVTPARFDAALYGLMRLVRHGCPVVGASFLLHAGNWGRAPEMLALARQHGATYSTFRPAIRFDPSWPSSAVGDRAWVTEALPLLASLAKETDVEVDVSRFAAWRDWTAHGYAACHGVKLTTVVTPDLRMWACPNRRGVADSLLGDLSRETFDAVWARHPGAWQVDAGCRVMCRLHPVNETLAAVLAPRQHEAFV